MQNEYCYLTIVISEADYIDNLRQARSVEAKVIEMNKYAWSIRRSYPLKTLGIAGDTNRLALEANLPLTRAFSLRNSGTAYYLLSLYQEALRDLVEAQELFQKHDQPGPNASVIRTIGNIFHSLNQNQKAIDEYKKSIEITRKIEDHQGTAYNLGNIGFVLKKLERYDEARASIFEALEIMEGMSDELGLSDAYNNLGGIYLLEGDVDEALKYFNEAFQKSSSVTHLRGMAGAKSNLGDYHHQQNDHATAIDAYNEALLYAVEMGEKSTIYETHRRLSAAHEATGNLEEALGHFKRFEQLKSQVLEVSKQGEIDTQFVNSLLQKSQVEKAALAEAKEKIQEKNYELRKLSIVASKMNEAMMIADATGKVEYMNDGFFRNSGYTREGFDEAHGKDVTLQQLSSRSDIEEIVHRFHDSSKTVKYDSPHTMKDGTVMWTAGSLSPVYKSGRLDKIVVVYSDITERKRVSDKLRLMNKDIMDSLVYAKSIQEAILPSKELIAAAFEDAFIFYEPRDIVSGDFYWFEQRGPLSVFAVVDCTGHGVPGAFMSLMGNDYLAEIITDQNITTPGRALSLLNDRILQALKQTGKIGDSKDGMDIALCVYNQATKELQYAGARNPLYIISGGELKEIKATKESIGGDIADKTFQNHSVQLQSGDQLYLFSDGFADQFGGTRGKKFMYKPFKILLLQNSSLPMKEQLDKLLKSFTDWKGKLDQIDDVCVLGVRVG